jgi:regulatory protein
VLVHLELGDPFEVMLEALERNRLGVGDELPPARKNKLLNDDQDIRVRDAALNPISYRARTRKELARRLYRKGFDPARIDPCLDRLIEKGFIDDGAVAAAFIRDRLRHKPRGRVALTSELRAKGVEGELITRTIDDVFTAQETDDASLVRIVARGWAARQNERVLSALASREHSPARDKARRRLVGYLNRRGFRGESVGIGVGVAETIARQD